MTQVETFTAGFGYGLLLAMIFMSVYEYMRKGGIRDLRRQVALLSGTREAGSPASGYVDSDPASLSNCAEHDRKHKFVYVRSPRKCIHCGVDE